MIGKNKAFLMQSTGNEEQIGMAEPQLATTFTNATFTGDYRVGPISLPVFGAGLSQGIFALDGVGNFTATEDVNDLAGPTQVTFGGTYSVAGNGRTLLTVTSPETFHYVAYPVSSSRLIGISIEPIQSGESTALLTSLDK